MAQASPTVAGWELMLRIRDRSAERGLKVAEIIKGLDVSQQYWSALTRGRGMLSEEKLKTLMKLLEFDTDERKELLALRDIAKQRHPYAEYSALFNDSFMRFYGLEAGAQNIRSFESGVVCGLLQTEDYIRALMKAVITTGRMTEVEQRVSARMRRKHLLDGPDPVQLSVVMGQAALMYQVGGPEVHREQLGQLLESIKKQPATLDLRVIPYEAGAEIAGLNSATFHLLDFDSGRLPTVGWVEGAAYGETTDDPRQVNDLTYLFSRIQSIALDRTESVKLIDQIASQ